MCVIGFELTHSWLRQRALLEWK